MKFRAIRFALCSLAIAGGGMSCGGEAKSADAAPPSDTGPGPVDGVLADANLGDASPDAATSGPATVRLFARGAPLQNVPVIFQRADGTEISTKMTGANGEATENIPVGAVVTVVRGVSVTSWVGAKPGDIYVLGGPATTATARQLTLPAVPRGATVNVASPCTGNVTNSALPVTVQLDNTCTTADFFVEAVNVDGSTAGSFYAADVAIATTGNIDLSANVLKPSVTFPILLSSVPAATNTVLASCTRWDGQVAMQNRDTALVPMPPDPSTSGNCRLPDIATNAVIAIRTTRAAGQVQWSSLLSNQPSVSADATTLLVPYVLTAPTLDLATRKVSWTQSTDGNPPDAVSVAVNLTRGTQTFSRVVLAPYAGAEVTVPLLPAAFAEFNPATGDTTNATDVALLRKPGGYDVMRTSIPVPFPDLPPLRTAPISAASFVQR